MRLAIICISILRSGHPPVSASFSVDARLDMGVGPLVYQLRNVI
jgi:hypothetical protein